MEPSKWLLHSHRQDPSVKYEARKADDGAYEVKHPGAPEAEAWTLDAESFEAIYEEIRDEEENA